MSLSASFGESAHGEAETNKTSTGRQALGQKPEVRSQRSEVKAQTSGSEVRGQRSEVKAQTSEDLTADLRLLN